MTYKFDPHTHSSEVSRCSILTATDLVYGYHAAGFGGIAVTDHLYDGLVSDFDNWDDCVDHILQGYKNAKACGDELGLDIILGLEIRFNTNCGDYLAYGLDEDFLRANPYLHRLGPRKFFKRYRDELLIIQAHPYRWNDVPNLRCIHGVEVYNGNPRHANRNNRTQKFCVSHPELYQISASDAHEPEDIGVGWMEFDRPVADSFRFREMIMRGEHKNHIPLN